VASKDPMIFLRTPEAAAGAGARYSSGAVVLDEAFRKGRLFTRWWSAAGQVVPEMYAEKVEWAVDEPADAFQLSIDGHDLAGGYEWAGARETAAATAAAGKATSAAVKLSHRAAGVEVTMHTRVDGSPFLVRWLEVANRSKKAVAITAVSPMAGMAWTRRIDEHLAPGTSSPYQLAYTHLFNWGQEGDFWFEPLAEGVKKVDGGKFGRSGWGRPAFWVRDIINGQTLVCELAWGGNYEFTLDCRVRRPVLPGTSPHGGSVAMAKLFFRIGLSGQDEALRVLLPGESVTTPAVHAALFQADTDAIIQATHHHVRTVVMPAQIPGRHVEIEANHRGYLCDRENEPDLKKDEEVAAAIGAEMYVIDAGWYGNDPNVWWKNTGDWTAGSWLPNGLEPVVAHAKKLGMRFGLWVEIESAGESSTLKKEKPQWLLSRDGKPINGRALDITNPEVLKWEES
jgi:alpha-galactosidase